MSMSLGREMLTWDDQTWSEIDKGVHEENVRAGVLAQVIPLRGPVPEAVTVPAEVVDAKALTIDEASMLPFVELSVEFSLTRQQVNQEPTLKTAATLARRATAVLTQAEDVVILQGDDAFAAGLLGGAVEGRGPAGPGLLQAAADSVVVVPGQAGTFDAVARAYSMLQARSHTGPYGLLLDADEYAATFGLPPGALVDTADRLTGLVHALHGTGAMPSGRGLLVSVGGDSLDLVIGSDPVVAAVGVDANDRFRFRVFERFVVRLKDPTACIRLEFGAP
jgi:uncharacterized linocin/CFP29 family protein